MRTSPSSTIPWFLLTFLVTAHGITCSATAEDSNRELLGVLAESYSHNRESFQHVDCKFEIVDGLAKTIEEALHGELKPSTKGPRTGEWLEDGANVRYELLCNAKDIAANLAVVQDDLKRVGEGPRKVDSTGPTGLTLPIACADRIRLEVGHQKIKYDPMIAGASFYSETDTDGEGIRITPFNFDVFGADEHSNPGRYLRDCLNGRFHCDVKGTQLIHGMKLIVVEVKSQPGPKGDLVGPTFGFDPECGYLPRFISLKNPNTGIVAVEVHVTEVRKCSRDRWIPIQVVSIRDPDTVVPLQVQRLRVTALDVDNRPEMERFRIDLPAGVSISAPGSRLWLRLSKKESFTPETLPMLEERMVNNVKRQPAGGARRFRLVEWSAAGASWRVWLFVLNLLIIILLGVYFIAFRRKIRK